MSLTSIYEIFPCAILCVALSTNNRTLQTPRGARFATKSGSGKTTSTMFHSPLGARIATKSYKGKQNS